jgi:hypothetical protein
MGIKIPENELYPLSGFTVQLVLKAQDSGQAFLYQTDKDSHHP